MRHVFLDVETQKSFEEVGGYLPAELKISFVGICIRDGYTGQGEFQGFFEKDLPKLWPILETADVIVGYNITDFDVETMRPYYSGNPDTWNVLDLLTRFKQATGHRVKLDVLAKETLGTGKIGDGLKAIEYYKNHQFRELAKYCFMDVAITRDIYDHGRRMGKLKYTNKWNREIETEIDFSFTPPHLGGVQMTLLGA
jgi:DEAD/DEAH box helicase domain-containing protein